MDKIITSPQNQRIKDVAKLRDHRHRVKQQLIVIDGRREIAHALQGGVQIEDLFICDELLDAEGAQALAGDFSGLAVRRWHVTRAVFEKIAFGQRAEGVVAVAAMPKATLQTFAPREGTCLAVLEGIEKPGNVGAVVRSADGAALGGIIVADAGTDLYNPNCIRASLGTIFRIAVCQASSDESLAWLRERDYRIHAARVDAQQPYTVADLSGRAAFVLGSEAQGLSHVWNDKDIAAIKLPMLGAADSLNISAAAAVLFYEALRQRSARHG